MTAFARATAGNLNWDIRSLNHRNLELSLKIPETHAFLEPKLRELIRSKLSRGKVECWLRTERDPDGNNGSINVDLLDSLWKDIELVNKRLNAKPEVSAIDLLKWPGVVDRNATANDIEDQAIIDLLLDGLNEIKQVRLREGEEIEATFMDRLQSIRSLVADIAEKAVQQSSYVRAKLDQRIQKLNVKVDEERLATEVAVLAQRADVDEEIDRLRMHLVEFENCMADTGPHGRRLGFLVQEMGREANTLGSKMVVPECINQTVDLKVLVDQIREQVQNVE